MDAVARPCAVVTGGSSGIGAATARALTQKGYDVVITGLTAAEVDASLAAPDFAGIRGAALDVADAHAVETFFAQFPRLDVLVNAAGIGRGADEFSETDFTRTIQINLLGSMRCCYAARTALAACAGAIVNIASMMSFFGSGTGPGYAASKGGIAQFTKSLAVAWAKDGIRTNAVAPGWIDTPMTQSLQANADYAARVLARTPMGRWGKPEEIAAGIVFLASKQASFVNGAILPIDGGYLVAGV